MNKRTVSIIIGLVVGGIVAVFVLDYISKRPDKLGDNPYEYNVDEYRHVDASLILYKEVKNIKISDYKVTGIDCSDGKFWLVGENVLQAIDANGILRLNKDIEGEAVAVSVCKSVTYIAFEDHVETYSREGEKLSSWDVPGQNCVFTSVDAGDEFVFVADGGNRRVLKYNHEGDLMGEFHGQSESNAGHGFIVPSANFDLALNADGELWVVNPGKHALEQYSYDGDLMASWQRSSMTIEGFTGCCNPAEFAFLPDGSFVTSEKGMVRVKVYDPEGKLSGVVAPPDKFEEEGKAPEVVVNGEDIVLLDFDRKIVRIFTKK